MKTIVIILASALALCGQTVTRKTAVVLIGFPDVTPPKTKAAVTTMIGDAHNFYREVSANKVAWQGAVDPNTFADVFEWVTVPWASDDFNCGTPGTPEYHSLFMATRYVEEQIRTQLGWDFQRWGSAYDMMIYLFASKMTCNGVGASLASGGYSSYGYVHTDRLILQNIIHEIGHTYGASHAGRAACVDEAGKPVSISNNCSTDFLVNQYGDFYDPMGNITTSLFHFSAGRKATMMNTLRGETPKISSWLTGSVTEAVTSGTYTIAPVEANGNLNAPQALRVRIPDSEWGEPTWYYATYRQPIGRDAGLPSGTIGGVQIHRVRTSPDPDLPGAGTQLIDCTPGDGNWGNGALKPGYGEMRDPYNNILFRVKTATAASVEIEFVKGTLPPPLVDTEAPTVPQLLSAIVMSSSQINLSWLASIDNVGVAGYRIYRNGAQITTATGTSYQNTGLAPSTRYTYTVAAFDAANNVSGQSLAASATTTACIPIGKSGKCR